MNHLTSGLDPTTSHKWRFGFIAISIVEQGIRMEKGLFAILQL